jgi:hypothetical protein
MLPTWPVLAGEKDKNVLTFFTPFKNIYELLFLFHQYNAGLYCFDSIALFTQAHKVNTPIRLSLEYNRTFLQRIVITNKKGESLNACQKNG